MGRPLKLRSLLVGAAIALVALAWVGVQYGPDIRKPPFVLWDFRAGMRFGALDDEAFRQTRRRFGCQEPMQRARLCELRTAGIPGVIRVVVDGSGRVARLQFQPDGESPLMREEGRRLAATWNKVRLGIGDERNPRDPSTTRWSSPDNRWGALMRYRRFGKTPFDVQLTESRRLAKVASTSPLAPTVLAMNGFTDSTDLPLNEDVSYVLKSIRLGREFDKSFETPVPVSDVLLPVCARVRLQLGAQQQSPTNELFAGETGAVLEQALAKTYTRSRLVIGEATWLVDSSGQGERILLGPIASDEAAGIIAVGVQHPALTQRAILKLRGGRPEAYCRASADVLVIEALPNATLRNVHRIPIGEDAATSHISRLDVVPASAAGDQAHVRIRYTTTHGTYRWMGSVDWEGVIASDPPRLRGRVPLGFEQITDEPSSGRSGTLVLTARSETSVSLGTLEKHDWGYSTRTISMAMAPNGSLDALWLLDLLFGPASR
jgi:hypothetical protein